MRKIVLVAILAAVPAVAQAKTLEDLLVEKGVITASEARGAVTGSDAKVYWNDGTRLEFPDAGFTAKLNTQIQTRYTFTDEDSDVDADDSSSFSIRRARLIMSGTVLNKEFTYKLQTDFVGDGGEDGAREPDLRDAYIQWEPCEGMGFRMGQYKPGVSRQWNSGTEGLQFPDRTLVSDLFSIDRMAGLRAFYGDPDGVWNVFGSVYNGESDSEGGFNSQNRNYTGHDNDHLFDAGVRANLMGKMNPFVEGDIDMTEELAINAGAAYSYSDAENDLDHDSEIDSLADTEAHRVSADVNIKQSGFSTHAEFFWMDLENDAFEDGGSPVGGYAQVGYFLQSDFEIAARYGYLDCDDSCGPIDVSNEAGISLNYYFWKNNLKAQLAYTFLNEDLQSEVRDPVDESDIQTNIWMFQLSAYL